MASDTTAAHRTGAAGHTSLSGLTPQEAQEFHKVFTMCFTIFAAVAAVAHLLTWFWRPWFPGPGGYASLESVTGALAPLTALVG